MTVLHPEIPEAPEMFQIDRRARAWLKALIKAWPPGANPTLYADCEARIAAAFEREGMDGPLPHDRLELVYMATQREDPSREAFVTLALVDFLEDYKTLPVGERSAKLPYQLAWARAGYTLSERTGMPGGIFRAKWPDVRL